MALRTRATDLADSLLSSTIWIYGSLVRHCRSKHKVKVAHRVIGDFDALTKIDPRRLIIDFWQWCQAAVLRSRINRVPLIYVVDEI